VKEKQSIQYSYTDMHQRSTCCPVTSALRQPRRAPRLLVSCRTRSTSTSSCTASTRHHSLGCSDLPRLRRASGCLGTSRGSSRSSSRGSSSTPLPRVWVPRHVAWLVPRLVAPLIVDYSGLVVDYFASAARPGASARRAARHAARRAARRWLLRLMKAHRRLLRLRRAAGCLGTSRGPSRGSSSTTPCATTSSCGHAGSTSATTCVVTTCLAAILTLLRVRRVPPQHVFRSHRVDHSSRLIFQTSRERQSRPQQLVGINYD
jgi:hypothetical protein